jgi:hypothetical protein
MIKRRLGDDFATAISSNLEVKAPEIVRKDAKGGKRRPRENKGDRPDRKPREQKEEKKEEKPVVAAEEAPKKEEAPKTDAPKREGRRRGGREGQ